MSASIRLDPRVQPARVDEQEPPVVAVVIPCYNYARYLPGCVNSVLSQAGVRTRVLIIDDASQDETATVAAELAAQDPRVEVITHRENRGHIATYNEGLLTWATGDYVTLLSADDELTPASLERSVRIMQEHPAVGMVYGGVDEFGDGARPGRRRPRRDSRIVYPGTQWLRKRCNEAVNVVPTPGTLLRLDVQRRVGGYDPQLTHAGDFDMWLRAALVGDVGYVRGPAQGRYRVHASSMSAGIYQELLADLRQRKLVFDSLFGNHLDELTEAGITPDATYARLAGEALWWACRTYEKGKVSTAAVVECISFAEETHPDIGSLRAFRALRRRQRLGTAIVHRTQIFIGTAITRRLANMYWWFRWKRVGG